MLQPIVNGSDAAALRLSRASRAPAQGELEFGDAHYASFTKINWPLAGKPGTGSHVLYSRGQRTEVKFAFLIKINFPNTFMKEKGKISPMRISNSLKYVIGVSAAVALLAGCSGNSSQLGPGGNSVVPNSHQAVDGNHKIDFEDARHAAER